MLVIGYDGVGGIVSHDLEVDIDDGARKIHDELKRETNSKDLVCIICVEDDQVIGQYIVDDDYDLDDLDLEDDNEDDVDLDNLDEDDHDE